MLTQIEWEADRASKVIDMEKREMFMKSAKFTVEQLLQYTNETQFDSMMSKSELDYCNKLTIKKVRSFCRKMLAVKDQDENTKGT